MRISKGRGVVMAVLMAMFLGGCGDARKSASSTNGSTASTVGGTSVTGDIVKIDLTTNRTKMAKGDVALVTVKITCVKVSGNCPVTNSSGQAMFAAQPITSTGTSASSVDIVANYSISAAATIAPSTQTLTLKAGSPAVYTSGVLTTAAVLGGQASEVDFPVSVTGVSVGAAILTVQSLSTTASIVIAVTAGATSGLFP